LIWQIITSEYPPQLGGVSDYTQMVANGLAAAGDEVHVWGPAVEYGDSSPLSKCQDSLKTSRDLENQSRVESPHSKVVMHRDLGRFTRSDLRRAGRMLDQFKGPRRLLVQWVPHGYGYRSMNLHFCVWLWRRARQGDRVEIIVHEPFLSFGQGSWKQKGVAVVHRLMTMLLLRAAHRVWMTIPAWEKYLRPYALGRKLSFGWLPVASNIPVVEDPAGVAAVRAHCRTVGGSVVGHFGTYDRHIAGLLLNSIPALLQNGNKASVLLLGRGSEVMRDELICQYPEIANRVKATGELVARDLSLHLSACDVMLQPYIDGVSSRRTSTMVALAHGVPVVTTTGILTESLWAESEAVAMAPVEDLSALVQRTQQMLPGAVARQRMSAAAKVLYHENFGLKRIIAKLREAGGTAKSELKVRGLSLGARETDRYELNCTQFPEYASFAESCRRGLSTVYSFRPGTADNSYGWKFGTRWPPSHWAFGRMRSLLALQDGLLLKPRRALEVAAGGGGLATCLAASGCDVVVNDLREEETAASLKEFVNGEDIRVEGGNLFNLSPERIGKFDLVLACEIIEHVAHPAELLEHLKNFLEPGGRLMLTTPNGSYFRNKLPTYSEVQDFTELETRQFMPDADGHLFLLTPRELCELAASVGLVVERLSVWGTPLLTGHVGFRYLAGRFLAKPAYWTELMAQRLPSAARARMCAALTATLRLQ
jgi:2-polyprenyl-3-methyl-5-hydroxy-6-metoxy-1,4-benzoquinol methylase/glycosyltransferase involved in cell wall biosynthesis